MVKLSLEYILSFEYIGLAFLANIGVLQLAAGYNKLHRMSFFNNFIYTCIFATITVIPPLYVFFIWNNINATGIIEGKHQAVLFFISFLLALIFTTGISSLIHRKKSPDVVIRRKNIEILRDLTYWQVIRHLNRKGQS